MLLWCSSCVTEESPSSSLLKLHHPSDSSKKCCYQVYRLLQRSVSNAYKDTDLETKQNLEFVFPLKALDEFYLKLQPEFPTKCIQCTPCSKDHASIKKQTTTTSEELLIVIVLGAAITNSHAPEN